MSIPTFASIRKNGKSDQYFFIMNDADIRLKEREQYVKAFNNTMISIWKEKIVLLGAVDTKSLLESVTAVSMTADAQFLSITFEQKFNEYGIYVDSGTGKEVSRGNPGDIGRDKVRKPKPWFFKKHIASVYNIRDFMAENVGKDIADTISNAISGRIARRFAVNNS